MVDGEVAKHTGFDLHELDVCLELDLVACFEFGSSEYSELLEHCNSLWLNILEEHLWNTTLDVETTLLSLDRPFFCIAVAIEANSVDDLCNEWLECLHHSNLHACACSHFLIYSSLEVDELFGYHSVESSHCR